MKKLVKRSMKRVLERSREGLLKKANVVGVGIGEKSTGGLLFAGSDRATLCNPIQEVLKLLEVELPGNRARKRA